MSCGDWWMFSALISIAMNALTGNVRTECFALAIGCRKASKLRSLTGCMRKLT
jgi:hypothetical protein